MKLILTPIIADIRQAKRDAARKILRIELTFEEARDLHAEMWDAGEREQSWSQLSVRGGFIFEGTQITWPVKREEDKFPAYRFT